MSKATQVQPDELFAAFSDLTRLRLLSLLRDGEVCVCDLVGSLDVPQPTASRHLAVLRRAGLVEVRKEGLWSHYKLAPARGELHAKLLESLACCAAEVTEIKRDAARLPKVRKARGCCD